jgi:hypothetical protein
MNDTCPNCGHEMSFNDVTDMWVCMDGCGCIVLVCDRCHRVESDCICSEDHEWE